MGSSRHTISSDPSGLITFLRVAGREDKCGGSVGAVKKNSLSIETTNTYFLSGLF